MNKQKSAKLDQDVKRTLFFGIPYIKSVSEKVCSANRKFDVRMTYSGFNKVQRFVHPQKDTLPNMFRTNVVYKINCRDCDTSYVGQTGKRLKTRIAEHHNHIKTPE